MQRIRREVNGKVTHGRRYEALLKHKGDTLGYSGRVAAEEGTLLNFTKYEGNDYDRMDLFRRAVASISRGAWLTPQPRG
jgi:hypothetical protein